MGISHVILRPRDASGKAGTRTLEPLENKVVIDQVVAEHIKRRVAEFEPRRDAPDQAAAAARSRRSPRK